MAGFQIYVAHDALASEAARLWQNSIAGKRMVRYVGTVEIHQKDARLNAGY